MPDEIVEKYSAGMKTKQENAEQRRNKQSIRMQNFSGFFREEHQYQAVIPLITFCVCRCVLF